MIRFMDRYRINIEKMTAHLRELETRGFSGMHIYSQGNEISFVRTSGFADRANQRPVTPETVFCIGSLTKSFTATAVLMLQMHVLNPAEMFWTGYTNRPWDQV